MNLRQAIEDYFDHQDAEICCPDCDGIHHKKLVEIAKRYGASDELPEEAS